MLPTYHAQRHHSKLLHVVQLNSGDQCSSLLPSTKSSSVITRLRAKKYFYNVVTCNLVKIDR